MVYFTPRTLQLYTLLIIFVFSSYLLNSTSNPSPAELASNILYGISEVVIWGFYGSLKVVVGSGSRHGTSTRPRVLANSFTFYFSTYYHRICTLQSLQSPGAIQQCCWIKGVFRPVGSLESVTRDLLFSFHFSVGRVSEGLHSDCCSWVTSSTLACGDAVLSISIKQHWHLFSIGISQGKATDTNWQDMNEQHIKFIKSKGYQDISRTGK